MQIVIDIDEKNYKSVMLTQNLPIGQRLPYGLSETIKNGTILPKHHGRLIDADYAIIQLSRLPRNELSTPNLCAVVLESSPTIIKAYKGE